MPIFFNKFYPLRKIIFFLGEGALIFLALLGVDWFMLGSGLFFLDLFPNCVRALLVTLIFQLCLYFFDQYELGNDLSLPSTITRMTQAFGVGCVLLGVVYYTIPFMIITSRVFWVGYLVICIFVFLWRFAYFLVLQRRLFAQNILVIGSGKLANDIAQLVEGEKESVYRIKGFVAGTKPKYNPHEVPVRASIGDFNDLIEGHHLERIVVALDERRGTTPVDELLHCKLIGLPVEQGVMFYERITGRILVEQITPSWIIFSDGFSLGRWQYQVKRFMDIALSSILLIVNLPVYLLVAIAIKLESKGPIFYKQERVGENNREFKLIKFRSMCQNAEKHGAVWAQENDSRITKVGSFIRRLRIDELPQLLNVLKGEMSVVGPRPERQVFVEVLEKEIPYYSIRHEVKPGITGWAQVCYPYGASESDALRKLEYDLYYMKNQSFTFDLLVIFKTVKTVLFQKGAR